MSQPVPGRRGAWITIVLLAVATATIPTAAADDEVCVSQPVGPFTVSGCVPVDECVASDDGIEVEVCVRPDRCLQEDVGLTSVRLCPMPSDYRDDDEDGFTPAQGDCDDGNPMTNPDAAEQPDGEDNDCDGDIDEGIDFDGDGWTAEDGDCDDQDPSTFPGAAEQPDGIDNDCDGTVDEGV